MLADKLDAYKGRGNEYVDSNIQGIQELFKDEENKKGGQIEDEEVILVKLYKVSTSSLSTTTTSFIMEEVDNLLKYMKFV